MDTKDLQDSTHELDSNLENTNAQNQAPKDEVSDHVQEEVKKENAADIILRKIAEKKQLQKTDNLVAKEIESQIEKQNSPNDQVEEVVEKKKEKEENNENKKTNYSQLSIDEILAEYKNALENNSIVELKEITDNLKVNFYKKINNDAQAHKQAFMDNGGVEEKYQAAETPALEAFKAFQQNYRDKKNQYLEQLEAEKLTNLKKKLTVIDKIKGLINSQESINKTFQDFKELQKEWHEIGQIPQNEIKKLWESYHYQVESFYNYVKINKELRDLDLKKNMEAKINLCEKAEELLLEPMITKAFKSLQKLHDQWREVGPVPHDNKEDIWQRFKETTSKINKKHQEYFQNLKTEQENNLKAKQLLSQKAEEIAEITYDSHKKWDEASKELIELQKIWRLIGFAPKKDNNKIYARFRNACDLFFEQKREFYAKNKEEQDNNLQLKTELCLQAEGLQNSTDWKKTTDLLINLQKKWKTIGPVSRRESEIVWQRFRKSCNLFFDQKKNHFANIGQEYDENLAKKQALIEQINAYTPTEDQTENLNELKRLQKEWTNIGHVPIKDKDKLIKEYRSAINDQFNKLQLDEAKKEEFRFKNKLENLSSDRSDSRLRNEREKLKTRLDKLNSDITLWDNNIGFFSKSKNAETMIKDFEKKIENAKKNAQNIKKQIRMIDEI